MMTLANENRVVSSEAEELILVDEHDNGIGHLSKAECHDGEGRLHRAFSVFLFNDSGELLLQRRSPSKRLWGGYWSNSCCSHPRRGEDMPTATRRRLRDELNVEAQLEYVYRFSYQAGFGEAGSENELCHVYLGRCNAVTPNENEIIAVRFVTARALAGELATRADTLTPWFRMEWQALQRDYRDTLSNYCAL